MDEEKVLLAGTLVFLVRGDEVLLPVKAKKIGAGCRNGYGGGIEAGESIEEAALRELHEESRVRGDPAALKKVAVIDFHNTKSDGGEFTCRGHVYLLSAWEGEPCETDEMLDPQWYSRAALPLAELMPADPHWLPRVLAGEHIYGQAWYGPRQQELLRPVELSPLPEAFQ